MLKRYYWFLAIFLLINMTIAGLDANKNNAGDWGTIFGTHILSFIVRYMIAIVFIVLSYPRRWWPGDQWQTFNNDTRQQQYRTLGRRYYNQPSFPEGLFDLLIYGASAWVVFDLTYNIIREGIGLCHVGSTSYPDLFFHWIGQPWSCVVMYVVKVALLAVVVYLKVDIRKEYVGWNN